MAQQPAPGLEPGVPVADVLVAGFGRVVTVYEDDVQLRTIPGLCNLGALAPDWPDQSVHLRLANVREKEFEHLVLSDFGKILVLGGAAPSIHAKDGGRFDPANPGR